MRSEVAFVVQRKSADGDGYSWTTQVGTFLDGLEADAEAAADSKRVVVGTLYAVEPKLAAEKEMVIV